MDLMMIRWISWWAWWSKYDHENQSSPWSWLWWWSYLLGYLWFSKLNYIPMLMYECDYIFFLKHPHGTKHFQNSTLSIIIFIFFSIQGSWAKEVAQTKHSPKERGLGEVEEAFSPAKRSHNFPHLDHHGCQHQGRRRRGSDSHNQNNPHSEHSYCHLDHHICHLGHGCRHLNQQHYHGDCHLDLGHHHGCQHQGRGRGSDSSGKRRLWQSSCRHTQVIIVIIILAHYCHHHCTLRSSSSSLWSSSSSSSSSHTQVIIIIFFTIVHSGYCHYNCLHHCHHPASLRLTSNYHNSLSQLLQHRQCNSMQLIQRTQIMQQTHKRSTKQLPYDRHFCCHQFITIIIISCHYDYHIDIKPRWSYW